MAFYRKIQNRYGLPLDNRKPYTKLDWVLWTATLTQERDDFQALVFPVHAFLNETPDRSPMTDWYQTKDARKVGFTARPVVGGVFAQMLYDRPHGRNTRAATEPKPADGRLCPSRRKSLLSCRPLTVNRPLAVHHLQTRR